MITTEFNLYVVECDRSRHFSGIRECTAETLLTAAPAAGDKVVAVFSGRRWYDADGQTFACLMTLPGYLRTHAGRSASLGEDGLEDSFGDDALAILVPEILAGAEWTYAPCKFVPSEDDELLKWRYWDLVDNEYVARQDA